MSRHHYQRSITIVLVRRDILLPKPRKDANCELPPPFDMTTADGRVVGETDGSFITLEVSASTFICILSLIYLVE